MDWMRKRKSLAQIQVVLILMLLFMAMHPLLHAVFSYSNHSMPFRLVHSVIWTVACGILAFLAFERLSQSRKTQAVLFGVLVLMFFPFSPVHFPQIFWSALNIAAIGVVAFSIAGDREEAPEVISQSILGEGDDHREANVGEGFSWLVILGVFVGPAFGLFWVIGFFLPSYFEVIIFPNLFNISDLWIVSIIVLIGTGALSLFLNIYVIRRFRVLEKVVPRRYLLPILYYFIPLLVIIDTFSEPYVDIGSTLILQILVLGGLVAIGFALACGGLLVAIDSWQRIDRGNGDQKPES